MTKQTLSGIFGLLAVIASATLAYGAATLKEGDPAPKLQVGKWVQGEPVKEFASGTAYIVEFWATWCGPCRTSIPHLNELHEKFKDKGLVVIGQDAWENDEDQVTPFIKSMGTKMTYRVALDDKGAEKKGFMAVKWMDAADQHGIPTAFVIDKKGIVAWIGHPMTLTEKILEEVLAGKFDVNKAAAEKAEMMANQKKMMALSQKFAAGMKEKNWAEAEAALAEVEKLLPENMRDNLALTKFKLLAAKGDYAAAYKLAEATSDAHKGDPGLQNTLAWSIVADKDLEKRDLPLAEKIAQRASDAAGGKDASILDTLARAQFMNGKKKEAVETEQKAADLTTGKFKAKFQEVLESYRQGKLPPAED